MGNFHCVPSSCAKVVYREYLPPVIRWQYPNEDWQEMLGDDYLIKQEKGKCSVPYYVDITYSYYSYNQQENILTRTDRMVRRRNNLQPIDQIYLDRLEITILQNSVSSEQAYLDIVDYDGTLLARYSLPNLGTYLYIKNSFEFNFLRADNQPDNCGECKFTIFNNGQIIHEEIRDICPEVEKLDCRLSDEYKEITIDKLPYLERIEVRNQSIDVHYVTPLDAPLIYTNSLPNECLNIYKTYILAPLILSEYVPLPGAINPYQHITQICSSPSCPPPEYEVICNCDCEECPENTCAVECEGHICCYDTSTGVSIKQIAVEDYCGGQE